MTQSDVEYLKTCLTESPILKYPNPQKTYVVFTDASDQAAAAVLTQEYKDENNEIEKCLLLTFLHNFLKHNSSGALLLRKVMQFTMPLRNGGITLKMQKFC